MFPFAVNWRKRNPKDFLKLKWKKSNASRNERSPLLLCKIRSDKLEDCFAFLFPVPISISNKRENNRNKKIWPRIQRFCPRSDPMDSPGSLLSLPTLRRSFYFSSFFSFMSFVLLLWRKCDGEFGFMYVAADNRGGAASTQEVCSCC